MRKTQKSHCPFEEADLLQYKVPSCWFMLKRLPTEALSCELGASPNIRRCLIPGQHSWDEGDWRGGAFQWYLALIHGFLCCQTALNTLDHLTSHFQWKISSASSPDSGMTCTPFEKLPYFPQTLPTTHSVVSSTCRYPAGGRNVGCLKCRSPAGKSSEE